MVETKYGIVRADIFNEFDFHELLRGRFVDISRAGINYKVVHFICNSDYETGFECLMTTGEYETWINDCLYLIVPNIIIPDLMSQIGLVEDIIFEDQWDAVFERTEITTRNGANGFVKTKFVTFTTCKLLQLEEGDDLIIQGLIDQYNSKETGVVLDKPILFNTIKELNEFKAKYSI